MTTLNISLPESMRSYVDEKVSQGGYSTASEYIRQLIREDQKASAQERLELMLMEGINSGPAREMTADDWNLLHSRVEQRQTEDKQK
ncbi:MAG: type II toxin-antitoxin system ParD family antitoxin [Pirellulales bacterium]|nr:type II toxin-antitoxin system ParD family antitoxin [Pirellulales bacterium]